MYYELKWQLTLVFIAHIFVHSSKYCVLYLSRNFYDTIYKIKHKNQNTDKMFRIFKENFIF